jgi:hypothetical protein
VVNASLAGLVVAGLQRGSHIASVFLLALGRGDGRQFHHHHAL